MPFHPGNQPRTPPARPCVQGSACGARFSAWRGLTATLAALVLGLLPSRLSAEPTQPPDSFYTPGGDSTIHLETFDYPRYLGLFPPTWDARKSGWRTASPDEIYYKLRLENGNIHLAAETTGEAIDAGTQADVNLRVYNKVRWRWRAWSLPINANEEDEDRNDSGAAVRLVFYGGLRPSMLKYVWSTTLPVGTRTESAGNSKIKVIVLRSGSGQLGEWVWEEVDAYRDYKELFGGEPRAVRFIGIITDSDNTESFVKADYDDFSFIIAPPDTTGADDSTEDTRTDTDHADDE